MTDSTGVIFDLKRYAVHDGPGIRTTVFLKGCPLRCRWCHNPESWSQAPERAYRANRCTGCGRCIEACPGGAISRAGDRVQTDSDRCTLCGDCVRACPSGAREILGRRVSVDELMARIERDVIFFDTSGGGVTVSGGEPLMQPDFVERLLAECKTREIHTALDTTCHGPWETLERIGRHVDLFLCDVKLMDPAAHRRLTGVSNELILENLRRLTASGRRVIIRMPVIPGVNDGEENLTATGEFVGSLGQSPGGSVDAPVRVDILPYNEAMRGKLDRLAEDYPMMEFEAPSPGRMKRIASKLESFGVRVNIGG